MRALVIPEAGAEAIRATAACMNERQRRQYLGRLAAALGYGGVAAVSRASGASPSTVRRGRDEVLAGEAWAPGDRVRAPGGGRPSCADRFASRESDDPDAVRDLSEAVRAIAADRCYGDPCKGPDSRTHTSATAESVSAGLRASHGFAMSARSCHRAMVAAGLTLQRNRKLEQVGRRHPLRNAQFHVRDEAVRAFGLAGLPVASVDTKAKVKLGNFAAPGAEWRPKGEPRPVCDHDFALTYAEVYPDGHPLLPEGLMGRLAVCAPYGVYDVADDSAHVTVGVSSDTSEFACAAVEGWWVARGRELYPDADEILLLADGGGSNRSDGYLYKYELALMLARCGLRAVTVVHLPPGTSKYNPVEHRLWPHVSAAWRGRPMLTLEDVVAHISAASTASGLEVTCELDCSEYLTEAGRREARRERGVTGKAHTARELLEAIATVERPLSNPTLSKWCYRIELT